MGKKLDPSERDRRNDMFQKGLIWCKGCDDFVYHTQFSQNKDKSNYGFAFRCRQCMRQYQRENGTVKKLKIKNRARYETLKKKYVDMFGGCCSRCGFSDGVWALEFNHVDIVGKVGTPSIAINSGDSDRALSELDKCVMLCSNCHKTMGKTWDPVFVKADIGYRFKHSSENEPVQRPYLVAVGVGDG